MVRFCPERTLGPLRPSYAIGLPLSGPLVSAASPRHSLTTRAGRPPQLPSGGGWYLVIVTGR
jgi:hypothetical protein